MIDINEGASRFADPGLDLLRKSILSLATTFFGSQHRQPQIVRRGYGQYSEVLSQLNRHLAQPELQATNQTLLTSLSCMLLEVFLPTGPSNFLRHQRGLEAIMALRGPPTESAGETATIFHGLRILSIVGALVDSRPSLYASDEWKQAPPVQTSEAGLLQHRIFAILADCTSLVSQRNALLNPGSTSKRRDMVLNRLQNLLDELEAVRPSLEILNQHQLKETGNISDMARDLGIANHVSATAHMLYNTAYICVLQIESSLRPSPVNLALQNAAATMITQCMELKKHEMCNGAPQSNTIASVATKVAWQALGGFDSPEAHRLGNVIKSSVNGFIQQSSDKERTKPLVHDQSFFAQYIELLPVTDVYHTFGDGRKVPSGVDKVDTRHIPDRSKA